MFVTAFVRPKTSYRSTEEYFTEFDRLAAVGVPILLFLDTEFADRVFPSNVQVVLTTNNMKWLPPYIELPANRNMNKDTVEYLCIQLSKLEYLDMAREFTTDPFLAWIDFAVFHMFKDKEACSEYIRTIAKSAFPKEKILAPGCWPAGQYDWNSVCWRFCGTFLLGHRDLFNGAYKEQMRLVYAQLPHLTWEVNYWAQMDHLFQFYSANHDDTLLSHAMQFVQPFSL